MCHHVGILLLTGKLRREVKKQLPWMLRLFGCSPGSPCTRQCRRVSIQPGDDRPEYYHQNAVERDLPNNHVRWHRLYHEVDHVGWHAREQCDGDTKAHALRHPRLRLGAARIDPDERAGQDHMREYHQGKVFLLVALCSEKAGQLHVVGTQEYAMYEEAAQEPGDEKHDPGDDEFLVHELSLQLHDTAPGRIALLVNIILPQLAANSA